MYVVATAGHVDHGKSTLVRTLTGTEPDRWDEERRRGLTIDLGFASTRLPSGREVSFVDVPGHERFLGNMLAGVGPASIVCFVVAADQGWQAQSSDHRDAVAALGIEAGLIVITRADIAPHRVPEVLEQTRRELAGTGLAQAPAVSVSALEDTGLGKLRSALDSVLSQTPPPDPQAPVRLWLDRAFSLRGAGTVVTGTLAAGSLQCEEQLDLLGGAFSGSVTVRGLQSHHQSVESVPSANRAAVNLRGVSSERTGRGDALLTPGAWFLTGALDVRRSVGAEFTDVPERLSVHLGTATVSARCRPFDAEHMRLRLSRPLPMMIGDRILLRGTDGRAVLGGAQVLDVEPPPLTRRGEGRRRAEALTAMSPSGDALDEVLRRGPIEVSSLRRMGIEIPDPLPAGLRRFDGRLVEAERVARWTQQLRQEVQRHLERDPLDVGLSDGAAADLLGLPDPALLAPLVEEAGLQHRSGRITTPVRPHGLGEAERAVEALEQHMASEPFRAPEAQQLRELRLGERELAAAERQGRVIRLDTGIVLLPSAPARAMTVLAGLEQPFTLSSARQALGTTRRTAVPLLEHLDSRGWTRRVDATYRRVQR